MMDHPNIAKVLDGGLTPTGQPFFVMELVNGLPLTRFCDEARLTTKERLELFVPICQAVQHAHQKGIVHRDFKPANILVTIIDGKPVPKVIDFGVAKATAGKLTDESMSTQFGAVVGTLEYMSPEQAGFSGVDIDTRADIYSLGVILYELLTGLRPIDAKRLKKAALTEMIRIIREEEPSKPSTRLSTDDSLPSLAALRQTEPRKLMALLRGELDWVVMKCLEKQRDRRYETANGLARDIQRYLADEAVEARPPSAGYRLQQVRPAGTAARCRGGPGAAGAGGGDRGHHLGADPQARPTRPWRPEQRAEHPHVLKANAELTAANAKVQARYNLAVDAIKTFHTGVSEDFLLKQNQFKELRDRLLKSAADFYGKLSALLGNETDLASRRALAASNFELADLTDKVGRKEEALAAHRAVLAARKALAAGPEADAAATVDVGRSLTPSPAARGDGEDRRRRGDVPAGGGSAGRPGGHRRRQHGPPWRTAGLGLAGSSPARATPATGWRSFRQARADQEVLAAAPGAPTEARRDLANTINRIGNLLARTGRPAEADAEYRKALAIYQKLADENPADTEFRSRPGDHPQQPRQPAVTIGQAVGVGSRVPRGDGDQAEAGRRQSRRHRIPQRPGIEPQQPRRRAVGRRASRRRRRPSSARRWRSIRSWPTITPPSPSSATFWPTATPTSPTSSAAWAARRGPRRLRPGDRDPRGAGPGGPEGPVVPQPPGLQLPPPRPGPRRPGRPRRRRGRRPPGHGAWEGLPSRTAEAWFETACAHAALAGLAGRAGSGVSAAEAVREADAAMALLRKTVATGYRSPDIFRTEAALDPLRRREDFQKLLAELQQGSAPKPAKSHETGIALPRSPGQAKKPEKSLAPPPPFRRTVRKPDSRREARGPAMNEETLFAEALARSPEERPRSSIMPLAGRPPRGR